ncbi:MAG: cytochrome [Myxococcaceae bacterium]|nr:cytochrome [Myxococcaceae bacterium]
MKRREEAAAAGANAWVRRIERELRSGRLVHECMRVLRVSRNVVAPPDRCAGGGGRAVAAERLDPDSPVAGPAPQTPTRQFADLVLAPVEPQKLPALRQLLAQVSQQTIARMQGAETADVVLPFSQIEGLHFARFVLLDDLHEHDASKSRTFLAFATDYDGPEGEPTCRAEHARAAHLAQLVERAGPGLSRIFAHCQGFEPGQLLEYLNKHLKRASTSFVGAPGRSVRQIRWEAKLRRDVELFLAQCEWGQETADEVRQQVLESLKNTAYPRGIAPFPAQPDLTGQIVKLKRRAVLSGLTVLSGLMLTLGPAGAGAVVFTLGLTAAGSVARFRWLERTDAQFQPRLDAETHAQMQIAAADENYFLQNQLSHVVELKPGPLRWLLLRAVFATLQLYVTNRYNHGDLGGIPSIHFARWVLGPHGKVIFFSNFDSSWQSYLGDFIDKASTGLTAVWSNTKGYPRTTWLTRAGSRDAGRFLAWTRRHQIPSQVWYSAYPGLSVMNINANTEIRRGLSDLTVMDGRTWLARVRNVDRVDVARRYGEAEQALARERQQSEADKQLERTKLPVEAQVQASPLVMDDIQGIILKGYGHKPEASYLLLAIDQPARAAQVRAWIAQLDITSAHTGARDKKRHDPLLNIAFSYEGLKRLGIEPALCDGFSTAFVQGSHHPHRARTNGDVGDDAPSQWHWGAGESVVHIVLLVFAESRGSLEHAVRKLKEEMVQHTGAGTLRVITTLDATTLPCRKEHFGFRDGIAQPVVRGSGDPELAHSSIAAGEILLGHRDGYGNVAQITESHEGFSFALNGSYMVLRQLEQDVEAFWRYCAARAAEGSMSPVAVAAKMVGRWPSGAPLVRCPEADPHPHGRSDEDDFGYFEVGPDNDGYGSRCPFGAHIRRAHPRDWGLGADAAESRRLSGLHRIMRRGRPYGPVLAGSMLPEQLLEAALGAKTPDDADEQPNDRAPAARGLHFMCFNANIERQFEFIQQQWCKNPKFAGQHSDADPLLGIHRPPAAIGIEEPGFTFQADAGAGFTKRLAKVEPFVHVRGSSYLFMPSLSVLKLLPEHLCQAEQPPEGSSGEPAEVIPPDEQLHTDRLIDNIRLLLERRYPDKQTLRDAHPKMHGCVMAELTPHPERAEALRHGLFAPGERTYRGWVRFSNEHQDPQADIKKDTRGLALKLCDVPGAKLLEVEGGCTTHDFIFLSTPAFVARDVAEFDELINGLVQKSWLSWLRSARTMGRLLRSRARHTSPLETRYWSVVPARLGPHIVKYAVVPRDPSKTPVSKWPTRDYLRETMKRQLATGDYCFDLYVQRFHSQQTTPVEDASVEWRERDAPLELLATLRILKQTDFDTPERHAFGEQLAFNPFRCLPEHRPLGGISRARRQVYRAISSFRHGRNRVTPVEPASW